MHMKYKCHLLRCCTENVASCHNFPTVITQAITCVLLRWLQRTKIGLAGKKLPMCLRPVSIG